MHTTPVIPNTETIPRFSAEDIRLLLEQARAAEQTDHDAAALVAHKDTGNAILVPHAVNATEPSIFPGHESGI
jgi:hypothetical protein